MYLILHMEELINKTLKKIKEENIKPEPLWKTAWPNYLFWGVFGAMIVLAAVSFSMAFHLAAHMDWDIYEYVKRSRVQFFFSVLPYFWIVLLVLFAVISYINIRHTKKGYRYSRLKVAGIVLLFSFVLGAILCLVQAQEIINRAITASLNSVPYFVVTREKMWTQPQQGWIAGSIIFVDDEKIEVKDFNGSDWSVLPDENTLINVDVRLEENEKIRVIGHQESEDVFRAQEIRPWECQEGCHDKNLNQDYEVFKQKNSSPKLEYQEFELVK